MVNPGNSRCSRLRSFLQYPGSLGDQNIANQTVDDGAPGTLLNDIRKHGERRRQASISIGEDIDIGTRSG